MADEPSWDDIFSDQPAAGEPATLRLTAPIRPKSRQLRPKPTLLRLLPKQRQPAVSR